MPDQSDESLDPKVPAQDASGSAADSSANESMSASPADQNTPPPGEEGLPEWEPLTPELVEDEAIRGDFVVRWVVVGLSLLLGISQIGETRTLLHLKSGQYLLSHGFLPPAKDVFSYTASDRKWVNFSWLFDILMSLVHSLTGGIGLSLIQGMLTGVAFGLLVHTVRPSIRTWWGSICAVLALLACYPQFTIQPELISIVGLSFVLWHLVRVEESQQPQRLWMLVPAIWLWAQLDQRAWFGWALILVWAVGEWMSRSATAGGDRGLLLKVALACVAVTAIHPFLWESWLAPVRLYAIDYPAMRLAYTQPGVGDQVFYPIWSDFHWTSLHHRTIAALVLAAATLVTLLLNRAHARWSHVLAFVLFNSLSALATHEFAAASLVNCVICTLNAQAWYKEKFGQVYSIDWRELLFSRGGRAVTVLSFFALAWLILSGRLDGPGRKRTGIGFEGNLASAMSDYEKLTDLIDDHPFHYSFRQGDLMIWGGLKTFVDSRAGLFFGGSGDADILKKFSQTRRALQPGSAEPDVWKATFDRYQIRQILTRLNAPNPDYHYFYYAITSGDFQLSRLNASVGIFLRADTKDETVTAYAQQHPFDPLKEAFRTEAAKTDPTRDWARPQSAYEGMFSLRRPSISNGIQAGSHYVQLAAMNGLPASLRAAYALLAIRNVNEGLRDDPNSSDGYLVLGDAYQALGQLEASIMNQGKQGPPITLRYYQSIAALQQALLLEPDDIRVVMTLFRQYQLMGRKDIQLDLLKRWRRLLPPPHQMNSEQRQQRDSMNDYMGQLEEDVARLDSRVAKHLSDGADRLQVAAGSFQAGGLLRAISTLEEDSIYLEKNPQAKLFMAGLLMEAGRGRDAAQIFEMLAALPPDGSQSSSRDSGAISAMTAANYLVAINLWGDQLRDSAMASVPSLFFTMPFVTLNPIWISADAYPTSAIAATAEVMRAVQIEGASTELSITLAQMEVGANKDASNSLRRALELSPSSQLRPLFQFYLECLTGERIDLQPEAVEAEEFTDLNAKEEPEVKAEDAKDPAK